MDESVQVQEPAKPATDDLEKIKAELAVEKDKTRNLNAALREEREKYKLVRDAVAPSAEAPRSDVSPEDVDAALLAARGYSDDEIDALKPLAKGTGKRLKDVIASDEAKAIVEWKRKNRQSQDATPAPGRPTAPPPKPEGVNNQQDFEAMKQGLKARVRANFG
jgi:hypothetical protein